MTVKYCYKLVEINLKLAVNNKKAGTRYKKMIENKYLMRNFALENPF